MRKWIIAFLAASCLSTPAIAADVVAHSRITAVTVYSDRATVTREAEVQIPAGASMAVIENLPAGIFPNSLRAEGKAEATVTLGAVESRTVNGKELAVEKERDLDTRLQQLNDQLALIQAQGRANESRIVFLQNLGQKAADVSNENFAHLDLKPEQWSAAGNAIYNGMDEALKAGVAQKAALRAVNIQIAQLNGELAQVHTGERSTVRVAIPLDSPQATTLTLKLSYQLPNATWKPVYDARLATASGKLTVTEFGEVSQATGEDWADVALTLSTAQPAEGAAPPHIFPQLVDANNIQKQRYNEAEKKEYNNAANVAAPASMAEEAVQNAPGNGGGAREAQFRIADFDTGGFVTEYRIAGMASARADSSANKVMIGALDSTATLLDQARPALSPHVFLMARVKIGGESPLLPGYASLFRDGVFIGSETLPFMRPGEESTLSFGVDDQMVLKRNVVADIQGTSGLLSKNQTQERRVSTTLHNLHKTAMKLEVLETVPVPRNDAIKLEMLPDATTAGYESNVHEVSGLNLWKQDVAASNTAEVKLGWRLTWPAGLAISGAQTEGVGVMGAMDRF